MKKKKDKLDKTIEELQEKWPDTPANIIESRPIIVDDGVNSTANYPIIVEEEVSLQSLYQPVKQEVFHNVSEEKELVAILNEPILQIGMKDTYLPFVLVKLKVCGSNTDARKMIFNGLVKVNNKVVPPHQGQITKSLSNFLLEVNGKKWEIFKID